MLICLALLLLWVGSGLAGWWGLKGWRFVIVMLSIYTAGILYGIQMATMIAAKAAQ